MRGGGGDGGGGAVVAAAAPARTNHPKVDLLATTLDIHPAQALGHLHYVWYFGLNYADDGDLTRYRNNLSKAAKYDGNNKDFVGALGDSAEAAAPDFSLTFETMDNAQFDSSFNT